MAIEGWNSHFNRRENAIAEREVAGLFRREVGLTECGPDGTPDFRGCETALS